MSDVYRCYTCGVPYDPSEIVAMCIGCASKFKEKQPDSPATPEQQQQHKIWLDFLDKEHFPEMRRLYLNQHPDAKQQAGA